MTLNSVSLFKLYFLSLIFATSHILGIWSLLLPISLGYIFLYKYRSYLKDNKILKNFIVLVVVSSLLSSIWKGTYVDILHSFKTIILLFSNVGVVLLLMSFSKRKLFYFTVFTNIIVIGLLLISKVLGYSVLEAVHLLFFGSSYHIVTWLLLLLNSLVLLEYSYKYKLNKTNLLMLSILFLMSSLLLQGRTGIAISAIIFIYILVRYYKISIIPLLLLSLIFSTFNVNVDQVAQKFGGDAYERGVKLGPRELIWGCYYDNIEMNNLLYGFNPDKVAGPCIESIGFNTRTESSFLSLISEVGASSILVLLLIFYSIIKNIHIYTMTIPILLAIIVRISTGDFLFFTVFDWIILYLAFGLQVSKKAKRSFS